jgi:peptide chain release factor subunit 1
MELAHGLALFVLWPLVVLLGWLVYLLIGRHGQTLLEQEKLADRLAQVERRLDQRAAGSFHRFEPISDQADWPDDPGSGDNHGGKVLILTPIKDAADCIEDYCERLNRLTYPHGLISLGFLESDSSEDTLPRLQSRLPALRAEFRRVGWWKRDFGYRLPPDVPRWWPAVQIQRRTVLAKSRNQLLFHALDDEDWVLWLDADVVEYPEDLIEQLLATGMDIVQPHCVLDYGGKTFDQNGWRDGGRLHLDDLRGEGDLVELDAVGGTVLLVRADAHRNGLIFPPFLYGQANPRVRTGRRPEIEGEIDGEINGEI